MQIPSLPTDNLYKFLAFSGLLLILISTLGAPYSKLILMESLMKASTDLEIYKAEVDFLSEKTKILEDKKKNKTLSNSKLISATEDLRDNTHKIKISQIRATNAFSLEKAKLESLEILEEYQLVGLVFGYLLASFGFVLWYAKVQKISDIRLLNEIGKPTSLLSAAPVKYKLPDTVSRRKQAGYVPGADR